MSDIFYQICLTFKINILGNKYIYDENVEDTKILRHENIKNIF